MLVLAKKNDFSATAKPQQGRVVYLDLMRVVSVFLMVVLHISAYGWDKVSVATPEWQTLNAYDCLARFCVPVFVMLSGVFFLDPQRSYSFEKLFRVKLLRIVTAFLFWSLIYACVMAAISGKPFSAQMLVGIARNTAKGHFHLWFMFMIAGLYLIVPFLRRITQDKKLTEYFLVLCFVFTFVLSPLSRLNCCKDVLGTVLLNSNLHFVSGFVGYFVAGYYFNRYELKPRSRRLIYFLGIISLIITVVFSTLRSVESGKPQSYLMNSLLPNVCLYSLSIFLLFKYQISKIKFGEKAVKVIVRLSGLSFGVYLSHIIVRIFFERVLNFSVLSFAPILSVPVVSASVFAASLLIAFLLEKIPKIGKYIM